MSEQFPTNLKELIDNKRPQQGVWVRFKDTPFEVCVTYFGKQKMRELFEKTKVVDFDTRTLQERERIDDDRFRKEYVKTLIKDWRGLNYEVLKRLVPVDPDLSLPPDYTLPCTEENKAVLIEQSVEFDQWLAKVTTDLSVFNQKKKEEEEKN